MGFLGNGARTGGPKIQISGDFKCEMRFYKENSDWRKCANLASETRAV